MRGHAGRAVPVVTALGLDAADGHHGFPGHPDHVAPESEREQSRGGKAQTTRADEHDAISQAGFGEDLVHPRETDLEGQRCKGQEQDHADQAHQRQLQAGQGQRCQEQGQHRRRSGHGVQEGRQGRAGQHQQDQPAVERALGKRTDQVLDGGEQHGRIA